MRSKWLFFSFLGWFFSCHGLVSKRFSNNQPKYSIGKLDTAKVSPYAVRAAPYIFETAFFAGTRDNLNGTMVEFFPFEIGKINIESGKVIASGMTVMRDEPPFATSFPIGSFPVQLSIAKIRTDERVAFSRILFSDSPVRKWEVALLPGQAPIPVYDTSFYGYAVDGGVGLFLDSLANAAFSLLSDEERTKVFLNDMEEHSRITWNYTVFTFGAHDMACFSTGWGDGRYGTYLGYDEAGKVCQLLTDFQLVDWYKEPRNDR